MDNTCIAVTKIPLICHVIKQPIYFDKLCRGGFSNPVYRGELVLDGIFIFWIIVFLLIMFYCPDDCIFISSGTDLEKVVNNHHAENSGLNNILKIV